MVPLHQLCSAEEAFSGKFGGLNLDGPPERWDTNGIVCLSVTKTEKEQKQADLMWYKKADDSYECTKMSHKHYNISDVV